MPISLKFLFLLLFSSIMLPELSTLPFLVIIPANIWGEGFGFFEVSTSAGMALGQITGTFIFHLGRYSAMFHAGCLISLVSLGLASKVFSLFLSDSPRFSANSLRFFEVNFLYRDGRITKSELIPIGKSLW